MMNDSVFPITSGLLSQRLKKIAQNGDITITLQQEDIQLLSISGKEQFQIGLQNFNEDIVKIVYSALLQTGFIDLRFSIVDKSNGLENSKSTSMSDFDSWFKKQLRAKILVPDTNIILDRMFSALSSITKKNIINEVKIEIPRIAILELENKANQNRNKRDLDKRFVFLGYSELLQLKKYKVQTFGLLNSSTLLDFSRNSGSINADALIRREIGDKTKNEFFGDQRNYVLITSDLVNSLSAVSEGIDTFYVARTPVEQGLRKGTIEQVARLLFTLAICFEKILVKIDSNIFTLTGMWEGKSASDWLDERIRIHNVTK